MLAVNQENEKLMEEYEKLASEVRLRPEKALPLPVLRQPWLARAWACRASLTSPWPWPPPASSCRLHASPALCCLSKPLVLH